MPELRLFEWDGLGPPVEVSAARPSGRVPQLPRISADADGTVWIAEGSLVMERRDGRWDHHEFGPQVGREDRSSVTFAPGLGHLFAWRRWAEEREPRASLYLRRGDAWAPFVPEGYVESPVLAMFGDAVVAGAGNGLVAVSPAVEEQPPSTCELAPIPGPIGEILPTEDGVFVFSRSMDADLLHWLAVSR